MQDVLGKKRVPLLFGDQPGLVAVVGPVELGVGTRLLDVAVAPRVARKDLVSPGSGEDHFDELAGQPGDVIRLVTHAHAHVFQVPDHPRQGPLEVASVDDHLVMLRAEGRGHDLRVRPLVEGGLQPGDMDQVEPPVKVISHGTRRAARAVMEPESMPPLR